MNISDIPLIDKNNRGSALIVDDDPLIRQLLAALLESIGFKVYQAENGVQAIAQFKQHSANIIIMDVSMPVMSGQEATQKIKSLCKNVHVPIIFLTAQEEDNALSHCLDAGGDDFITKPINHKILISKIQAQERIAGLTNELSKLYYKIHDEQSAALQIYDRVVSINNVATEHLKKMNRACSSFSGDVLLTAFNANRELCILLGDFTGHGLSAAIGALPVGNIFQEMCQKGFSAIHILNEINERLCHLLPQNMFMAAQFVVLSPQLDWVTIINCAMPDIYILNNNKSGHGVNIKQTISAKYLALGIIQNLNLDSSRINFMIETGDHILLSSDGVIDAINDKEEMYTEKRYLDAIRQAHSTHTIYDSVIDSLDGFISNATQADDISFVDIPCEPKIIPVWKSIQANTQISREHFENSNAISDITTKSADFSYSLKFESLKKTDPIPMLLESIKHLIDIEDHFDSIFTIINELFCNALEFGLLKLDGKLKHDVSSRQLFNIEKAKKLQVLNNGSITIRVWVIDTFGQIGFVIRIEDSGDGFDYKKVLNSDPKDSTGHCIKSLQEICSSLQFFDPGNCVQVSYTWVKDQT